MPTVLKIKKYRFFFFSKEDFEPPHIHIESNDNYAKFWLDPIQLAKSIGYRAYELNEIRKIIIDNKKLLIEKWYEYFSR